MTVSDLIDKLWGYSMDQEIDYYENEEGFVVVVKDEDK